MSKDDHQKKDALDELTYCEDANANMSRMDCLPAEDSHGAALRKSVLTGLAKTSCTVNPLEAWAATDAMNYNQRAPRKKYDWEAIAAKLGASSTQNDEKMAQTIASKQAELKPTIKDDKFNVDGKLGPKTISILDLHEETSGHINKKKEDKKAETGTKEIAKTITDPQKEQLIKSADPTSQQEAKSNSSQIESQSTPVLQGNEFLIKALETIGLEQDALQPEGANKAFRKIVSEFSGTGDQIAKLIVLAKVHKNPSYTYPIFTGLKYIGKSINIDKKDRKQKPEDHDTTDGICRNLCAHSVSVYNAVLSGSVPSTEDLQTDYNDLRKPNIGLVCNTVTEMMCRIALSNTVPGVKPDDDTGTIDFVNGHSEHGYKNPSPEAQSKLQETDLNKANIGDVIVYYDKSEFTKNGNYKFKHAAIIIDYIEDKNGVRSYAFMGASTLHDASGKNVGGVAPRTTKGGTKDPTSPKGWGFIQTQEDLNNIYTDKIKLVYTSSEKFKAGSVRAGDPYVECITFVWPTGSGKTTQHTQAQQKSEHDDTTQFLASESNETKEKPSIHTPNVEQNVTEPRKDITSLESQPHTTELKQTSDSQKTNDVKTTHKKDTSKPTNKKISNKKDNSTTTKTSSKKSDSKIIPLDESLMIDKKTPDLKNDDEISIELTDTEIENAIKKNKQLISKYKGDPKFEQSRILQAVGSSSSVFDKTSILAIANWQAKRNLPPNGIYDDECRKIDFILTVYETAANNTDINILFVVSQLSYESGWKFSKINNYGGIKAPTENGRGLKPLDPKHASLDWTHENWTDETYKIKQKDYESDPNRSPNPKSGKKITPQGKSKHGKTKYKVQEYFRIFDSLTDFIQNHRSNIVTNVTKKVTKMKDSGKDIYVSDTSQQEAKIREIIQDADFVLRTIQSGKSWHYATSEDYVKHISDRMNIVENMLKEYKLTPARIQNETIQDKSAE